MERFEPGAGGSGRQPRRCPARHRATDGALRPGRRRQAADQPGFRREPDRRSAAGNRRKPDRSREPAAGDARLRSGHATTSRRRSRPEPPTKSWPSVWRIPIWRRARPSRPMRTLALLGADPASNQNYDYLLAQSEVYRQRHNELNALQPARRRPTTLGGDSEIAERRSMQVAGEEGYAGERPPQPAGQLHHRRTLRRLHHLHARPADLRPHATIPVCRRRARSRSRSGPPATATTSTITSPW